MSFVLITQIARLNAAPACVRPARRAPPKLTEDSRTMLIKRPQGFTTALQSHRIAGMNRPQKQFSLNCGESKKKLPISNLPVDAATRIWQNCANLGETPKPILLHPAQRSVHAGAQKQFLINISICRVVGHPTCLHNRRRTASCGGTARFASPRSARLRRGERLGGIVTWPTA